MGNKTVENINLNKKSNKSLILIGLLISYFPSYRGSIFNFLNIQAGPQGPQSSILWNWLAVAVLISFIYLIGVPSAYEEFVSIRNRFKNFAVILYI